MFLCCPQCGEYSEERPVVDGRITCDCGERNPHRLLPAVFVTGASGSGKSTVCHELTGCLDMNVLDADILWGPHMDTPEDGYARWRFTWLRTVANLNQSGRQTLLFAGGIPNSFGESTMAKYIGPIHWLALVCDNDTLAERLRARPNWRKSSDPEVITAMQAYNESLRAQPGVAVIDTTTRTVAETAAAIEVWIDSKR